MNSKYKLLNSPEIYFKDCFNKNKPVACQDAVFIQNSMDITEDIYLHVFPTQKEASDQKDAFFGVGLIMPNPPEIIVDDVRSRIAKGVKSIPTKRFILSNMDISIIRIIRYAQFNLAFEDIIISYVYDGQYEITIGGVNHCLTKGNAVIIAPNVSYASTIDNDDTVVFNLMIRVSSVTKAFLNLITENNYLSKLLINMLFDKDAPAYTIVQAPPDERLSGILLQLFELQQSGVLSAAMNNTLVQLFICDLFYYYEDYIQNKSAFAKNDVLAADIVSYLHKNYATASLQEVSAHFSLSANYVSRFLKEKTGMNYMSIIKDIRLEKARELLISTDLTIEEICSVIGYSDARQLRYLFRERYGISPSAHRKKLNHPDIC